MSTGAHVIALVKDGERFVFVFEAGCAAELLQTFGRYAADPELNFTWYDAAVLSQRVRRLQAESDQHSVTSRRTV